MSLPLDRPAGLEIGRTSSRAPIPRTLQLAAAMFVLYGVTVLLNAFAFGTAAGWENARDFPGGLLRPLGAGLVAWGLLRRTRWAWWAGLGLALGWLTLGGLKVLVLERGDIYWLPPSEYQLFGAAALLSLGAAVALLLGMNARAEPRPPIA
jgi:hypothetical protein